MNLKTVALSFLAGAATVGLLGSVAPEEAKAWTTCSNIGNTTYCDGSNGSSTYTNIGGTTYYDHNYGGNSWSGSCSTIGSTTWCD